MRVERVEVEFPADIGGPVGAQDVEGEGAEAGEVARLGSNAAVVFEEADIADRVAAIFDVAWAVSMKYAEGYTRPGWTLLSLVLLAAFVFLLGRCLTVLPVGTAYAVWTGIGAAGTVLMGAMLFGENLEPLCLGDIALVVAGIAVLKIA